MPKSSKSKSLPVRPDKTIDWLNKSRDDWKNKTQVTKSELKVAKQAKKRAQQDRKEWKEECAQLKRQHVAVLQEKTEEIADLKMKIELLEQENLDLKKKHLLRRMIPA
jgi:2-succinyl-5-enolpyruvyl-6-hydroxy-3-cyclohexene-1-carboxylate synthase